MIDTTRIRGAIREIQATLGLDRPAKFIQGLKIHEITSFDHLLMINDLVFRTVPWTTEPYKDRLFARMENGAALNWLYINCISKNFGGWCGLNTEFFQRLIREYGLQCESFNYGVQDFTHIVAIVTLRGKEYLIDPYFNRHYVRKSSGEPLSFGELMTLVKSGSYDEIISVFGESKKLLQVKEGWDEIDGYGLESSVLESFRKDGLEEVLYKNFGDTNVFNMMKVIVT